MLESNVIKLAKARLEALKVLAADHIEFQDVFSLYSEIKGLVDLRYMNPTHLSDDAINELILIDNLASLTMRNVNPAAIKVRTEQGARLDEYMTMNERELIDLIFKHGGRFNNQDAISVAIHRGLLDDVLSERLAYEQVAKREVEASMSVLHD
ncbi:MAG: hypothetical protein VX829_07905 [Pseudomonadota bacterium]|uniref:Uncharacterized protein n=1 Tax=Methylophaga aminisulfidivorans MP TaxID=1026882 RepID=F5T0T2_9GAMM|nr:MULTISPECIES: hypothetical protein [Methylophaga]MEC9412586.1 hypothetical protein [Pseudomonadota bacterium]EGL53934.1 hypothetical protein MAMP_00285 [Methylophaga aminisulfidivorans MP]WVI83698.1 hypothetical protein VSX76_01215 [Methylophaga thalassica]HIC45340.1 hypothetical protein [Methylophaga sp.]HIM41020.1 hypothetical protein [Methylophaga aminisulfidivorans]